MSVKIDVSSSRLRHAELFSLDGIEFWCRPEIPNIPTSVNDIIHYVEESDRIDLLANKYYKNPRLWWVIAHVNNFINLPEDLIAGQRIRIPDPFYVRKYLF